jgi:dihydroflavonol-4-reductase
MRVLVTGANGLLGNNLVRELLNAGHEVRAMVRATSNTAGLEGLRCERVLGDIRDQKAVRAAADGCEVIFSTAAVFSYYGYSLEEMMGTATQGTLNVVRAAKDAKVRRLVLTSSTAVLGGSEQPTPLDESAEQLREGGPDYFASKAKQERLAIAEAKSLGVELVVANPSVILGPYDFRPTASLATVTGYLLDPLKMTYPGGIDIAHAQDVARGHILLAERGIPYERHILGGENWTFETIHRAIAELTGQPAPRLRMNKTTAYLGASLMELGAKITRKPPLATRALAKQVGRYFWYSHDKAARLGYKARPARQTLTETIGWLLDSPHLTLRQKKSIKPQSAVLDARDHLRSVARAGA